MHLQSHVAKVACTRSIHLLNEHLAAAIILQDRMLQSPQQVRDADFIMVDNHSKRITHLMDACAGEIAEQVEGLSYIPCWPVQLGQCAPIIISNLPDPVRAVPWSAPEFDPLDVFAQSVLDAAAVAEAFDDVTTLGLLGQILRDIDRYLWLSVETTNLRALAH